MLSGGLASDHLSANRLYLRGGVLKWAPQSVTVAKLAEANEKIAQYSGEKSGADRCSVCGDTDGGWCSIEGCPRPMPGSLMAPGSIVPEPASHEAFHFVLHAPGYEALADVLQRAFGQAAHGKGKERHAQGEPFTEQVMQDMARRFGIGALLGQAFKKSEESQRLPVDRGVNELLGAIVYLAGAVIAREREAQSQANQLPTN